VSGKGYEILSLDQLDRYPDASGSPILRPLRRRLGFHPFGVNCWEAAAVGRHVIEPHSERDGDEELYVVVRGRARFTVAGESVDAPAGTLVHVPADTPREAVAEEPDTLVLAAGARVGEVWRPAPWEEFHIAVALAQAGEVEPARERIAATIAAHEGAWQGPYNAACFEALYGDRERALAHLADAARLAPDDVRRHATSDDDLAGLRDDPRFEEALG
jgi:hypothetical protein